MAEGLDKGEAWAGQIKDGVAVDVEAVMDGVGRAYEAMAWGGFSEIGDLRAHFQAQQHAQGQVQGRSRAKTLTYHMWFRRGDEGWPAYLKGLPGKQVHGMMKNLARFRLGCHGLEVDVGRHNGIAWQDRQCTRCSAERLQGLECKVGDEHHMVFDCSAMDDVRATVPGAQELIQHAGGCLRTFMQGDTRVVLSFVACCVEKLAGS